jgi:hypothetical protein
MGSTIIYTLLEILKYTLPSIIVLAACYMIIQKFLTNDFQRKQLAVFQDNIKITTPMRMSAYERIILVLERMEVHNLINRFYIPGASATDLQLAMIDSIRGEYEYNLSQQIYISNEAWQTFRTATEQEIAMINGISQKLPQNATAKDLSNALSELSRDQETETPRQIAILTINAEAKKVLTALG